MSRSPGNVCVSPVISSVTFVIFPVSPDTVKFDGYGLAGEASLIVMAAGFEKFDAQVGPPVGVAAGVDVFVEVGVEGVPLGLAVGVFVAVAVGQLPLPFVPTIWNTWSGAVASMPQVAPLGAQLTHAAVPKPPPGFCHAAGKFEVMVLSSHAHCPPGVKSILA